MGLVFLSAICFHVDKVCIFTCFQVVSIVLPIGDKGRQKRVVAIAIYG